MTNPISIELKGWKYISDPVKPANKSLQIVTPDNEPIPQYLYKYYGLSKYSIDAIKNRYIYASCPFELNDPFDSMNLLIDYKNANKEIITHFYLKNGESLDEIKNNLDYFKKRFPREFALFLYSGMGIISLSANILHPLMWAHYANAHHGFAIKLNRELLKNNAQLTGPFPMNYQDQWQPFDFNFAPTLAFLYQTNIKHSLWDYEQEYRYVAIGNNMYVADTESETEKSREERRNNRKMQYPPNAIEEIVLGFSFIKGLVKPDCDNNICHLEFNPDDDKFNAKKELLNFICDNNINTSKVSPKDESNSFELITKPIKLKKRSEFSFIMEL